MGFVGGFPLAMLGLYPCWFDGRSEIGHMPSLIYTQCASLWSPGGADQCYKVSISFAKLLIGRPMLKMSHLIRRGSWFDEMSRCGASGLGALQPSSAL